MPGSIHLSVTEWGETTAPGLINTPYSVKVSVGKNQYQSAGREDFSFPVTTIREDLIIMLCNSGGNVVEKEEVKTISIAEKGDAEVVFHLQHGGNLKLKLSFVLNEQDKEKISEMRSSALKRKHEELIKGIHGTLSPGTSIQVTNKDNTKLGNQKVSKIPTEPNRNKIEETLIQATSKDNTKLRYQEVSKISTEQNRHKIEGTLIQVTSKDDTKFSNQEVPKISTETNRNKIEGTLIQVTSKDNTELSNQEVPKMSAKPNRNKIEGTLIQITSKDNTKLSNRNVPKISTEPNRNKIEGTLIQVTSKDYTKLSNQNVPKTSTKLNQNKIEEHGSPHLTKGKKKVSFLTTSQSGVDLTGISYQRSTPIVPNENPSDNIKKMINAIESNAKQNLGSQIRPRRTPVNRSAFQTSTGSMSYENEDIKERRVSHTIIRRSFSAGNLAEAILQNDPNFTQTPYLNETPVNRSAFRTSIGSMSYENEDIKERRVSQTIIRRSFSTGNFAEAILQDDPNITQTPYFDESTPGSVSNERSVEVNTGSTKTNLLQGYMVSNQQKNGGLPNKIIDERVEVNMENMVTDLLQKAAVRQQHKEDSLSNKVFDVENFYGTSPYLDQETSRNERSCMDRISYRYELFGMLMPQHLCLTSAPKKVMNFFEKFTTNGVHNDEKGAASNEVQLEIGSRSETNDPKSQRAGISILNGWGPRIFIVIVACGTIILNTK